MTYLGKAACILGIYSRLKASLPFLPLCVPPADTAPILE